MGRLTLLWLVSLLVKASSIVDPFWGPGFVIANWVYLALTPEGFPAPKWLISILVTIVMTLLLLRVSGVSLLEKTLVTTKPGYEQYVESTSAFVPWFPRKR